MNFLIDNEGDFTRDDILKIYESVKENLPSIQKEPVIESERCPFSEVYAELCKYVREHDADSECREIYIKDHIGYIETTYFEKVMKDFSWAGYKRKELLGALKYNGLLFPSSGRPYDYSKRDTNGVLKRVYRIVLQIQEEEECA